MLNSFFQMTEALHIPNAVVYSAVILVALYLYGTWNFKIFKKVVGCPGPKPIPFLGTLQYTFKGGWRVDLELKKQYGRSYGMFDGINPVFVTCDLDIIKQVGIKDFDSFVNHRRVCINHPINKALGMLKDDEWRQRRQLTSRAITAAKLRRMSVAMDECAKELADNLAHFADSGDMFEIRGPLGNFTMDVIARTQFAIDFHSKDNPDHPFLVHASKMFSSLSVLNPAFLFYFFFPRLLSLIEGFNIKCFKAFPDDSITFFKDLILDIIKRRTNSTEAPKQADFLQLLLDTRKQDPNQDEKEEEHEDDTSQVIRTTNIVNAKGIKLKPITDIEIAGGCINFMLAGFETTASTLAWASYALALNQDVQEKLYEEVRQSNATGNKINYDMVSKMQYLDQVLNETLRRYSVITRTERVCNRTCQVGPYTIPKGMVVQISAVGVHHDEEYWPDPLKFDPERFAPENRHRVYPNSVLTFGVGPRICLGTRFAIVEIKIALVHILAKYQILPCAKTENPITYSLHKLALPANGIWVILKHRPT